MAFTPKYPTLYRVYDEIREDGLTIKWQEFTVIGETPMCWYVLRSDRMHLTRHPAYATELKKARKRVLKEQGGRRFCYTDKTCAMRSYLERKKWQARHAALSQARADAGVKAAMLLLETDGEKMVLPHVQPSEYIQAMNWADC